MKFFFFKGATKINANVRLQFRQKGQYRFSKSGFGTVFDVCTATWNVGEKKPPVPEIKINKDVVDEETESGFEEVLYHPLVEMLRPGADIYAIGLQECDHISKWVVGVQQAIGAAGMVSKYKIATL